MLQHINNREKRKKEKSEGRNRSAQIQLLWDYLHVQPSTASMAAKVTGIPQKCITRLKRKLEKEGRLWPVSKGICAITGCQAWYLTTDIDHVNAPINYKEPFLLYWK